MQHQYAEYKDTLIKIADIRSAAALMQWDQETYMPAGGAEMRGRQLATIEELAHRLFTDVRFGELLETLLLKGGLNEREQRNVELSLYDFNKRKRLPGNFVRKLSEAVSKGFQAWIAARKANSFLIFEQPLDELVKLKVEEAELLGYEEEPYDALLNDYERGLTVKIMDKVFAGLLPDLSILLERIKTCKQVDDRFLKQKFSKDQQWKIGLDLLRFMGFDFNTGRQDLSEHPFSVSFHNQDVRVTTRVDKNDLGSMSWSCIHEGGHALYEQGLSAKEYGLPLGEACSYSIHESQSRLWENSIGRGVDFWQYFYPRIQEHFPEELTGVSPEQFYRGINKVQSSLNRTEADEITYHFHVFIRYELEKRLINKSMSVKDIPEWWNEQYEHYLGVKVPDGRSGCLQDVHWSHGSFGYFPTYCLGSLYAAQLHHALETQVPNLNHELRTGNTASILQWLRINVYQYGRFYTAEELCEKATGEVLNPKYFIQYLQKNIILYIINKNS